MMKIIQPNNHTLIIRNSNSVHRFQGILFVVLGLVFTLGVLSDSEASPAMAIVPSLILIAGIVFLSYGGWPDEFLVDKGLDQLKITIHHSAFKQAEEVIIPFTNVAGVELETYHRESRRNWGIMVTTNDGQKIQGTPSVPSRKKAEAAIAAVYEFWHIKSKP